MLKRKKIFIFSQIHGICKYRMKYSTSRIIVPLWPGLNGPTHPGPTEQTFVQLINIYLLLHTGNNKNHTQKSSIKSWLMELKISYIELTFLLTYLNICLHTFFNISLKNQKSVPSPSFKTHLCCKPDQRKEVKFFLTEL